MAIAEAKAVEAMKIADDALTFLPSVTPAQVSQALINQANLSATAKAAVLGFDGLLRVPVPGGDSTRNSGWKIIAYDDTQFYSPVPVGDRLATELYKLWYNPFSGFFRSGEVCAMSVFWR